MKPTRPTAANFIKTTSLVLVLLLNHWGGLAPASAQSEVLTVPCLGAHGSLLLAEAVKKSNTNPGPDTIELAANCTFGFFSPFDSPNSAALPEITDELLIRGNGATLERRSDTSRVFRLIQIGAPAQVTLENLTIRNGAFNATVVDRNGGGIYAKSGTRLILNGVTVQDNAGADGAGVTAQGAVTIIDSAFLNNRALQGGGLFATGPVVITNTTFFRNEARQGGGLYSEAAVKVSGSRFEQNLAAGQNGGGLFVNGNASLTDTEILTNTASDSGGGLAVTANLAMSGGRVSGNSANNGGGLAVEGTVHLSEVALIGNIAEDVAGGISAGTAVIENSRFERNQASFGGGLAVSELTLKQSHLIGNSSDSVGGAIFSEQARLASNSLIGNRASIGAGLALATVRDDNQIINNLWLDNIATIPNEQRSVILLMSGEDGVRRGRVSILHNTITGSSLIAATAIEASSIQAVTLRNNIISHHAVAIKSGTPVQEISAERNLYFANTTNELGSISSRDNFEADPRFVDPANGDFHLADDSQAIDKGFDQGVAVDFEGLTRPQGKGFDLGAFEFAETPPAPTPGPNPSSEGDFRLYLPSVIN